MFQYSLFTSSLVIPESSNLKLYSQYTDDIPHPAFVLYEYFYFHMEAEYGFVLFPVISSRIFSVSCNSFTINSSEIVTKSG